MNFTIFLKASASQNMRKMSSSTSNQVLVLDEDLCNYDGFKIIRAAFKSSLVLANQVASQKKSVPGTISICIASYTDNGVEVRSVLSPVAPAPSTLEGIMATLNAYKDFSRRGNLKGFYAEIGNRF